MDKTSPIWQRFESMASLSEEERQEVLETYTKFMITRHPFERLLSAYRNKLGKETVFNDYFQVSFYKILHKLQNFLNF